MLVFIILASCITNMGPLPLGFPGGLSGNEPASQCRIHKRLGFNPWVGKIPWRRAWQPTPVFLPGESHGQRSLEGYSPQGRTELDMTQVTSHAHITNTTCVFRKQRVLTSVQFSCSVVSDSLGPHESQHARPPCPSPTPGVHSDSRPSSQ